MCDVRDETFIRQSVLPYIWQYERYAILFVTCFYFTLIFHHKCCLKSSPPGKICYYGHAKVVLTSVRRSGLIPNLDAALLTPHVGQVTSSPLMMSC